LDAQHRGIAVMHQHSGLFGDLSIAENVFMGHPKKGFLGIMDEPTATFSRHSWQLTPLSFRHELQ
jgi:rhamnose transport system ATP-binding protein